MRPRSRQSLYFLGVVAGVAAALALSACVGAHGSFDIHEHRGQDSARISIRGKPVVIREGEKTPGDVVVVDGRATVNGEVSGDLVVIAGKLELGPRAHVRGELVTVGTDVVSVAPGARVDRARVNVDWAGVRWMVGNVLFAFEEPLVTAGVAGVALILLLLLAWRLVIRPYDAQRFHRSVDEQPFRAGLVGFLVTAALHVILVLAFLSRYAIGLVPVLALALFVLSMVGWIAVAGHVGRRIAQKRGWQVGPFWYGLAGVGIGCAVFLIPVFGQVTAVLASWVGIGALFSPAPEVPALPPTPTAPAEAEVPVAA